MLKTKHPSSRIVVVTKILDCYLQKVISQMDLLQANIHIKYFINTYQTNKSIYILNNLWMIQGRIDVLTHVCMTD